MRDTICFGLTDRAKTYLDDNCLKDSKGDLIRRVYDDVSHLGLDGDGPQLFEYDVYDGSKVREVIQHNTWSSGPKIFLCLKYGHHLKCKWTKVDIGNNV